MKEIQKRKKEGTSSLLKPPFSEYGAMEVVTLLSVPMSINIKLKDLKIL